MYVPIQKWLNDLRNGYIETFYEIGKAYVEGEIDGDAMEEALNILNEKYRGSSYATYQQGLVYWYNYSQNPTEELFDISALAFEEAADDGEFMAKMKLKELYSVQYAKDQFNTGYAFSTGEGLKINTRNAERGAYWYRIAWRNGIVMAAFNLGVLHYNEEISPEEGKTAKQSAYKYWKLAAEQGNVDAMYYCGTLCLSGYGLDGNKKDVNSAMQWFAEAAKRGHEEAQKELNKLKNLEHTEIGILPLNELIIKAKALEKNGNIPLAIKCYQKAIQKGSMESCNDLGTLYINCAEKERDSTAKSKLEKDAFQLIETAAKSGIKLAYRNLGVMMYQGTGCVKDVGSAIYWLTLADKTDDIVATQLLVSIYSEQGEYQKALPYVEKLAYNGNSDAQLMLGLAYYDGDIYQEDKEQAMYWLALSAKQGNEAAIESLKDIIEEQKSKKTRMWNSIKGMLFHGVAGVASEIDYIEADVENDIVVDSVNMGIGECIENILNAVGDKYEKKDIKRKY